MMTMSFRVMLRLPTYQPAATCIPGFRCLSLSHRHLAVDKSILSKLRKQTGIPFINCKKALEKHNNDFDQAKQWLLEQAQKEGWARATKLQVRPMSQGLVAVLGDNKKVTLLEVNCETDFVARNEKFVNMVTTLVQECNRLLASQPEKTVILDREQLNQMTSSDQGTLADIVALNIGKLGENMQLRRAAFIRASDEESVLCSYVHPSTKQIKKGQSLMLGKFGAVVEVRKSASPKVSLSKQDLTLSELGHQLCQHIVGMNPKSIGEFNPEDMRKSSIDEERQKKNDSLFEPDDFEEEGVEQDVKQEVEKPVEYDELLSQDFLLDTSMTVGELTCLNGVEVNDFVRYACGEELDGK